MKTTTKSFIFFSKYYKKKSVYVYGTVYLNLFSSVIQLFYNPKIVDRYCLTVTMKCYVVRQTISEVCALQLFLSLVYYDMVYLFICRSLTSICDFYQ